MEKIPKVIILMFANQDTVHKSINNRRIVKTKRSKPWKK